MARFEIEDAQSVGKFVRARVRDFEGADTRASVFFTDRKGMWDLRITYGDRTHGTAYISAPDAGAKVAVIRWPGGDIEIVTIERATTIDGFVLGAIEMEMKAKGIPSISPWDPPD